jgi:hypothetical protein
MSLIEEGSTKWCAWRTWRWWAHSSQRVAALHTDLLKPTVPRLRPDCRTASTTRPTASPRALLLLSTPLATSSPPPSTRAGITDLTLRKLEPLPRRRVPQDSGDQAPQHGAAAESQARERHHRRRGLPVRRAIKRLHDTSAAAVPDALIRLQPHQGQPAVQRAAHVIIGAKPRRLRMASDHQLSTRGEGSTTTPPCAALSWCS